MMQRHTTIRDVARLAGVSVGTVSRVLNGHRSVTPETMRKVMSVMEAHAYQPNAVAQSMRTRNTRMVGFIISDISNTLFSSIVKAAEGVLQEAGYTLVLANTGEGTVREVELIHLLQQRRMDGLIMTVFQEGNTAVQEAIQNLRLPVVLLDRELPIPVDAVYADHASGMFQATKHLLELGHRRIALITESRLNRPGRERIRGFEQAFQSLGLTPDPDFICSRSLSAEYGFRESYSLLTGSHRPTAIIAGGNQILVGLLKAVRLCSVRIPEDLSVISCDDTDLTALATPPVTVVQRSVRDMGRQAAALLIQGLEEGPGGEPRRILLPTELLLRQSCAPPCEEASRE
jgi:LacI family transcriptional regulator